MPAAQFDHVVAPTQATVLEQRAMCLFQQSRDASMDASLTQHEFCKEASWRSFKNQTVVSQTSHSESPSQHPILFLFYHRCEATPNGKAER